MLDSATKHRLDTLRDILVGKVPDPKSQVDQITTGLIYKFMNDMDSASVEAGGNRRFFKGEYRKYSWENLNDTKVGGVERVKLYGEAIEGMYKHPSAPKLFREIFKNSYLPFRDPSTLNMFLTEIGDFQYSHSEKLGDAYEYLLSYMGSQGDAGQFRTPRHIIDFIVEIVDPKKNETILDPACGTAGFLISSYKHIMKERRKLTAVDLKKLSENLVGYDISPDMTRLSLVNMYLHNFTNPKIFEYDTLSSDERWNEYFDVILANPPFFSPKGGIQPHSRFGVDSKRAEVLFVDYIIQHLKPNGRAGIIVPEGIIFQTGRAYKVLRKKLVESCLVGVISLPAGVFQPYSGVKTSILILDKVLSQSLNHIYFAQVENDGYTLGAQRTPVEGNELPDIAEQFKLLNTSSSNLRMSRVIKSKILDSDDTGLNEKRYLNDRSELFSFPPISIGEICEVYNGSTPDRKNSKYWNEGEVPWFTIADIRTQGHEITYTNQNITLEALHSTSVKLLPPKSTLLCCTASIGACAYTKIPVTTNQQFNGLVIKTKYKNLVYNKFLFWMTTNLKTELIRHSGSTSFNFISVKKLKELKIPLPPLEIQREIVTELDGYQKIIDGAQQVVDNYKPNLSIDPSWKFVELGKICKLYNGRAYKKEELLLSGRYPVLRVGNFFTNSSWYYSDLELDNSKYCYAGDLLYAWSASFGARIWKGSKVIYHYHIWKVEPNTKMTTKMFLKYLLDHLTESFKAQGGRGGIMMHLTKSGMEKTKIPLPSLGVQEAITKKLLTEEKLIEANKHLIEIYTKKIQDRIAKVWGD